MRSSLWCGTELYCIYTFI